jgi:hypothetical protein
VHRGKIASIVGRIRVRKIGHRIINS